MMATNRSTIDVEWVRQGRYGDGEWMVVQRMTAEDAESMAYEVDPRDGVHEDLLKAAQQAAEMNAPDEE